MSSTPIFQFKNLSPWLALALRGFFLIWTARCSSPASRVPQTSRFWFPRHCGSVPPRGWKVSYPSKKNKKFSKSCQKAFKMKCCQNDFNNQKVCFFLSFQKVVQTSCENRQIVFENCQNVFKTCSKTFTKLSKNVSNKLQTSFPKVFTIVKKKT